MNDEPPGLLVLVCSTAECSLRLGRLLTGLPILHMQVMRDGPVLLYRAHSFLTQLIDTPMASAISRFAILPFCFCRIIHAALDLPSFPTIPGSGPPICLS